MTMTPRALLFDLDGTLIDSLPDLAAAANALLAELGRPALAPPSIKEMVGDGTPKLVERVLAASGGSSGVAFSAALGRFLVLYEADPTRLTRPYPHVEAVLGELQGRGWQLAICTNKPERATRAVVAGLGLDRFFAAVLGGDSAEGRKPDPRPLLAAVARLRSVPAQAVMVGDHRNDIAAARAAAIPVVFARYGYGESTLAGEVPDAVIDDFGELPQAIDRIWQNRS